MTSSPGLENRGVRIQTYLVANPMSILTVLALAACGGVKPLVVVCAGTSELLGIALLADALRERPCVPDHPLRWAWQLIRGRTVPVGTKLRLDYTIEGPEDRLTTFNESLHMVRLQRAENERLSRRLERLISERTAQPALGVALLALGVILSTASNLI